MARLASLLALSGTGQQVALSMPRLLCSSAGTKASVSSIGGKTRCGANQFLQARADPESTRAESQPSVRSLTLSRSHRQPAPPAGGSARGSANDGARVRRNWLRKQPLPTMSRQGHARASVRQRLPCIPCRYAGGARREARRKPIEDGQMWVLSYNLPG
jgi:hypothetical protein